VLSEVADGILRANLDVISEVFPLLFSPVLLSRSLAFQVSKNQFHCDGCGICRQVVLNLFQ
jgi:hypothetical protein